MNRWFSLRLIPPLAVILLCVGFLIWIDRPEYRYALAGNARECSAYQLINLPESVDFVAIGSSRVRRGIDSELLMQKSKGLISDAYNLGRPGRSALRNLRVLRDILGRPNDLKFAFVEIDVDLLFSNRKDGGLGFGPASAFLSHADIPDVYAHSLDNPALQAFATARFEYDKIRYSLVGLFSGLIWDTYQSLDQPAPRACWQPNFDKVFSGKIARERNTWRRRYDDLQTATIQESIKNSFIVKQQLELLDEIRQLASEHNITFLVSRQGAAYEPPLSNETVEAIKAIIPEFVYPPQNLVRRTWKHFADNHHYDTEARNMYTKWLARQFVKAAEN